MPRVGITYSVDGKLAPYAEALRRAGLEPVPLAAPGPSSIEGLDGILISGGADVNPSRYGQERHAECEPPDEARDLLELSIARAALEADLPLLCICRGMQLLNVVQGGDLIQHLAATAIHVQRGVDDAHSVSTRDGTRLAQIAGDTFTVNSRHHQAVGRVGAGLAVSATSPDGVIEGLEMAGRRFVVAVQWHPEDRVASHASDRQLFQAFAKALTAGA
ncbi:MAG TPA: gamma-glutamyl-gamma-aminobutyrate hydrolase family protein [Bryobacteraceae bacterium]|nr:gamma-glutamyl-gamma-aminobutyrate hydrolase family protein [Bryobacteraceae bacterium]